MKNIGMNVVVVVVVLVAVLVAVMFLLVVACRVVLEPTSIAPFKGPMERLANTNINKIMLVRRTENPKTIYSHHLTNQRNNKKLHIRYQFGGLNHHDLHFHHQ